MLALPLTAIVLVSLAGADPAYRVGTATNRVALLPVRCERDIDPSLCRALGESVAIEMAREPRIEVVNPHDLEVLVGAASLTELQNCGREDCFTNVDFTSVEAAYLIALDLSRIGPDARLVVRMVDLKRGQVIDRDEAKAPVKDERAIEDAARAVTMNVLVRRGLAQPVEHVEEDAGVRPIFWAGLGAVAAGALAAGGGGVLGVQSALKANDIADNAATLDERDFDRHAREARTFGYGADLLFVAGGALVVAGGAMMIAGGL